MSQTLRSPRHEALRSLIELFAREHSVVSWVLPFVVYQTRHRLAFFGSKFQFVFLDGRHQRFVPLIALVVGVAGASRQPNPQARYFPQLVLVQRSYRLVVDAEDRLLWRWLLCGGHWLHGSLSQHPKDQRRRTGVNSSDQRAKRPHQDKR